MACKDLQRVLDAFVQDDCFTTSSSANEKGKHFSFENKSKKAICRVRIDGCLIISHELRKCDFLFKVIENDKYYLIELKGLEVFDAVEQIMSTYKIVNIKIKAPPLHYKGIIVSSAVPAATEQRFRKLQDKCYRENRLSITKTHIRHTERI